MRSPLLTTLLLLAGVPCVAAQSSQFGARGLGLPGRGLSAAAVGTGGALGLFDPNSVLSAAAITTLSRVSIGFESIQEWRSSENVAGTGSIRNNRFPLFRIAGPVRGTGLFLAGSVSSYTNQDFGVASNATVDIRGEPVMFADTASSVGGLNDLRVAAAYNLNARWAVGAAAHIITGSARNTIRRTSLDSLYGRFRDSTEFAFNGWGVSVSLLGRLSNTLAVAASVRSDGHANVDIDSTDGGRIDLPYRFAAGILWQPAARLQLAIQGALETWSAANSDLLARGGNGATNTYRVSAGGTYELTRGRPHHFPLRLGGFYGALPFPLQAGERGKEYGISAGTGIWFAKDRAAIDLALEHIWRSETAVWKESAWNLWLGMSVRP